MEIQCDNCSKLFHKKPHRIKRSKTHFCCVPCIKEYEKKNSVKIEVECSFCGKKHLKNPKDAKRNVKNFCSRNCMKSKVILNCLQCKKPFRKAAFHDNCGLCKSCYLKDFFKKNPEKLQEKRLRNLSNWRIKNGVPLERPIRKRIQNGYLHKLGYKIIYKENHGNAWQCGRIFEHTFVMSEFLKRPLKEGETVHHINGIRHDNRIENLELWNHNHPYGQRVSDKLKFYKEFIEQYGGKVDLSTVTQIAADQES